LTQLILRPNADASYTQFPNITPPALETEELYVNGRTSAGRDQWTKVGNSPYLNAIDDINRIETNVKNALDGDYEFQDTSQNKLLNAVYIDIYCKTVGNEQIGVYFLDIDDGIFYLAFVASPTTSYAWHSSADQKARLSSPAKINGTKIYVQHVVVGGATVTTIDCARVRVVWQNPTTHYDKVDEDPSDEDATRIYTHSTATTVYIDTFNKPASGIPLGATIDSIRVYRRHKSIATEGGYHGKSRSYIKKGADESGGAYQSGQNSYLNVYDEWTINPWTGLPWTIAEVDALEIGVQAYTGYDPTFGTYTVLMVTQVWILIVYTLPVGVIPRRKLLGVGK